MDSNETGGLISTNIIWSHVIFRYTTAEDSFMKVMRKNVEGAQKPETRSLKSGGNPSPLLLIARGTGERCKLHSGVEFAGLKTKK